MVSRTETKVEIRAKSSPAGHSGPHHHPPPANERSRPRHARERDGRPESLLCQPSQRLALGHGHDVPRRRHRRHHRTTQNRRGETVEPPEWMSRSRKPWKATSEPQAEACGQAPGSLRSSRGGVGDRKSAKVGDIHDRYLSSTLKGEIQGGDRGHRTSAHRESGESGDATTFG